MKDTPMFRLKMSLQNPKTFIDENVSDDVLQIVFQSLQRIAQLENPRIDSTLEPIRLTNNTWDRMKQIGEQWRAIIYVDKEAQEIKLSAILIRDDETYSETVRNLWNEWAE